MKKSNMMRIGSLVCAAAMVMTVTSAFGQEAAVSPASLTCPVCRSIVDLDSEYETQEVEVCANCETELYLTENPDNKDEVHIASTVVPEEITSIFNEQIDPDLKLADYEPYILFDSSDLSDETIHLLCNGVTEDEETVWAFIDFDVNDDGEAELQNYEETEVYVEDDVDDGEDVIDDGDDVIDDGEDVVDDGEDTEDVGMTPPADITIYNKGGFVIKADVTYVIVGEDGEESEEYDVQTGWYPIAQSRTFNLPEGAHVNNLQVLVLMVPGVWTYHHLLSYDWPAHNHKFEFYGTIYDIKHKEIFD